MRRTVAVGIAALSLLAFLPSAKADNLVVNGSFEMTTLTESGLFVPMASLPAFGSAVDSVETGWTVNCAGSMDGFCFVSSPDITVVFPGTGTTNYGYNGNALYGPMPATSPDGGNFVAADGDAQFNAAISQTITGLTPGGTYTLTFYQAAAQQVGLSGPTTEMFQVTFGSQIFDSTTMDDASEGFIPWNQQTMTFVATSATQALTFLSVGTPGGEPPLALLDGVDLEGTTQMTPEPSSLALLGAGVMGLLVIRRMRQNRS